VMFSLKMKKLLRKNKEQPEESQQQENGDESTGPDIDTIAHLKFDTESFIFSETDETQSVRLFREKLNRKSEFQLSLDGLNEKGVHTNVRNKKKKKLDLD